MADSDWSPAVYDVNESEDVSEGWFRQKKPDSYRTNSVRGTYRKLNSESYIEYQRALKEEFSEWIKKYDTCELRNRWKSDKLRFFSRFSFSIPTEDVVEEISNRENVVEMFSGTGYWAYEIQKKNPRVKAYDADPPEETWSEVTKADSESLLEHRNDHPLSVVLSWPPVGEVAYNALMISQPEYVYFVGEQPEDGSQVMGSKNFYLYLRSRYQLDKTYNLPSLPGFVDNCYKYVRSATRE